MTLLFDLGGKNVELKLHGENPEKDYPWAADMNIDIIRGIVRME